MPAPATLDDFIQLVRRSGLVADDCLDGLLGRLRVAGALPIAPSVVADRCVKDGLLTYFQAEQLLQGKYRGFSIGKYKVLERIGFGGMGQVYLCEHERMRRRVAVKVLPSSSLKDPGALERFEREARAAAALDHPNIVRAFDLDQDGPLHFLVMEYVDGPTLYDLVRQSGPMAVARACHYIRQASIGMQHAHESGLVHRDIKPSNILVDRSGTVKLLDLGLARFLNDHADMLTKEFDDNHVLGTADYVAPEQTRDSHNVDIRADIYGLGATFYFLLAGRAPFAEGTIAQKLIWHQTKNPPPLQSLRRDLPLGLAVLVDKMMAKKPHQRFQTPIEVAHALAPWTQEAVPPPEEAELPALSRAALAGAAPLPPPPPSPVREPAPALRHSSGAVPIVTVAARPVTTVATVPAKPTTYAASHRTPNPFAAAPAPVTAVFPLYTPPPPLRSRFGAGITRLVTIVLIGLAVGTAGGFGVNYLKNWAAGSKPAAKPANHFGR